MMDKVVFILLGKTGSGKSTILNMIEEIEGPDLPKLASYTSRPRRSNEMSSNEYIFIDNKKFDEMVANNLLMEHRKYDAAGGEIWQYGTGFPDTDYSITTMSPDMVQTVMFTPGIKVYPIYITVSDALRFKRLELRESKLDNPNYEELYRRYKSDDEKYTQGVLDCAKINRSNTFHNDGFAFNTCRDILIYIDGIIEKDRTERMNEYATN